MKWKTKCSVSLVIHDGVYQIKKTTRLNETDSEERALAAAAAQFLFNGNLTLPLSLKGPQRGAAALRWASIMNPTILQKRKRLSGGLQQMICLIAPFFIWH